MDPGISTIRPPNQATSELDLKRLHPVSKTDKKDAVKNVLNEAKKDVSGLKNVEDAQTQPLNKDELKNAVAEINTALQNEKRSIQFKIDDTTGQTIVQIVDSKTGEQIKQIPSEEALNISKQITEQIDHKEKLSGLIHKGQA